jgi:hypothetical protein
VQLEEWCDYDDSQNLTEQCRRLGADEGRLIQKWKGELSLVAALNGQDLAIGESECFVCLMDHAEAGWARLSLATSLVALVRLAEVEMTDGFLIFIRDPESVLSVDVESDSRDRWLETTLIGEGLSGLKGVLLAGPRPERVVRRPSTTDTRRAK